MHSTKGDKPQRDGPGKGRNEARNRHIFYYRLTDSICSMLSNEVQDEYVHPGELSTLRGYQPGDQWALSWPCP